MYFVTSESRLGAIGHNAAVTDRYQRCRSGSADFVGAKDDDAPDLITLTAILTDVMDPAEVAAWEGWEEHTEHE